MRMKIRALALVAALSCAGVAVSAASTVRGRIVRKGASGQYPAVGVTVSVNSNNAKVGRSAFVYTGSDGMYYLSNVPAGDYQLEIWVTRQKPMTYNIRVRDQAFTDIAPIVIP